MQLIPGGLEVSERLSASDVGAWLLKASPEIWNIGLWLGGEIEIDAWSVVDNYRSKMMSPDDRVVIWISGRGKVAQPGIWGLGRITDHIHDGEPDENWIDLDAAAKAKLYVGVEVARLDVPVARDMFLSDANLRESEVIRIPHGSNPSYLSPDEFNALQVYL